MLWDTLYLPAMQWRFTWILNFVLLKLSYLYQSPNLPSKTQLFNLYCSFAVRLVEKKTVWSKLLSHRLSGKRAYEIKTKTKFKQAKSKLCQIHSSIRCYGTFLMKKWFSAYRTGPVAYSMFNDYVNKKEWVLRWS